MFVIFNTSVNRLFIGCFGEYFCKVLCQSWIILKPSKIELGSLSRRNFTWKKNLLGNLRDFNAFP